MFLKHSTRIAGLVLRQCRVVTPPTSLPRPFLSLSSTPTVRLLSDRPPHDDEGKAPYHEDDSLLTPSDSPTSASFHDLQLPEPPSRLELFKTYPAAPGSVIREAWLETLDTTSDSRTGDLIPLHPEIWSARPRIDCIKENLDWQEIYKTVDYTHVKNRYQMPMIPGRPWPQKGTGRARHRSQRSPIWVGGGKTHGPKNPRSFYYMLSFSKRLNGLIHTLATKFAQDDVHIVRDLNIPTDESKFIDDLIDERGWGLSTLFVDFYDIMPENITAATDPIHHVNLMPAYGLNVHSMVKHKTLVLTQKALDHIESKLLFHLHRSDIVELVKKGKDMSYSPRPNTNLEI